MAGSYNHCVDDDGRLIHNDNIGIPCENGGDSYETITEMYGMIWYLAKGDAALVEEARRNYQSGIDNFSPGIRHQPYPSDE